LYHRNVTATPDDVRRCALGFCLKLFSDSMLTSCRAGGKLFHAADPLKAKLRCLVDVCTLDSWTYVSIWCTSQPWTTWHALHCDASSRRYTGTTLSRPSLAKVVKEAYLAASNVRNYEEVSLLTSTFIGLKSNDFNVQF